MGPHTLEALQAELDDLWRQVEALAKGGADNDQYAAVRFRMQMLQAMLDEQEQATGRPTRH